MTGRLSRSRERREPGWWVSGRDPGGPAPAQRGTTTSPPGVAGRSRPTTRSSGFGHAARRAAAVMELADVDQHDLEAAGLQPRSHPVGAGGHHDGAATTTELAQKMLSASRSVSTRGSGTSSSSARAEAIAEGRRADRPPGDQRPPLVQRTERQVEGLQAADGSITPGSESGRKVHPDPGNLSCTRHRPSRRRQRERIAMFVVSKGSFRCQGTQDPPSPATGRPLRRLAERAQAPGARPHGAAGRQARSSRPACSPVASSST